MWNERSPFAQPSSGFGPGAPYVTRFGRVPVPASSPHMAYGITRSSQHMLRRSPVVSSQPHQRVTYFRGLGAADTGATDAGSGTLTAGILGSIVGGALTGALVGAVGTHGWKGTAPGALAGAGVAALVGGLGALFVGQPMVGVVSALGGAVGLLTGWTVSGHQHHRE